MKKHNKKRKYNKIQNKKASLSEKMLIVFVEIALLCDFTLYPIPVKAAELEIINEGSLNSSFTIQDKIIEMENSSIELEKAIQGVETKEKALDEEIKNNQARLQAEINQFKQEQQALDEQEVVEQERIEKLKAEEIELVAEAKAEEERIQKQALLKQQAIKANQEQLNAQAEESVDGVTIINLPRGVKVYAKQPPVDNKEYKVLWQDYRTFTGYNSDPWQTDDTPCTAANGFDVCKHGIEDTVAANFLKFGTKIRIPQIYGDRVFTVRDRMNRRYPNSVDIWMIYKKDAKELGRRQLLMQVVQEVE